MEPLLFFAAIAVLVIALAIHNGRRRSGRARELFTRLAPEVGGRVTAPKLGTPSLRFQVPAGEARLSVRHQKGTEVTTDHLRLRIPAGTVGPEEATRIRTRPTRVVHARGGEVLGGTGLPERWHVQSTEPGRVRTLLDADVRGLLEQVETDRRAMVEVRDGRITILWGEPLDVASARRLLTLGRTLLERLEPAGDSPTPPPPAGG